VGNVNNQWVITWTVFGCENSAHRGFILRIRGQSIHRFRGNDHEGSAGQEFGRGGRGAHFGQ
jgi:hypothetical protein